MSRMTRVAVAAALGTLVATGLSGCLQDGPGDVEACETLSEAFTSAAFTVGDEYEKQVAEGALEAAGRAESPDLKTLLENLGSARLDAEDPQFAAVEFLVDFLDVGEACEARGVTIEAYETVVEELQDEGMTVADVHDLYGTLQGFQESGLLGEGGGFEEATTFGLDYETRFDEEVLKEEASKSEELAGFYKNCAGGDMEACDSLYWESPIDSDLELFATLCGGERTADDVSAQCVDVGR